MEIIMLLSNVILDSILNVMDIMLNVEFYNSFCYKMTCYKSTYKKV